MTPPEFLRVMVCLKCRGRGCRRGGDGRAHACLLCLGKRAVTVDVRDLVQLQPWAPSVGGGE